MYVCEALLVHDKGFKRRALAEKLMLFRLEIRKLTKSFIDKIYTAL